MKHFYSLKKSGSVLTKLSALFFLLTLMGNHIKAQNLCVPPFSNGCSGNDKITYFGLNGFSNPSDCEGGGYGNFRNLGPSTNLMQTGSYPATISTVFGNCGVAIWIDFDNDSIFSPSEKVGYTTAPMGSGSTTTITTSIPANAPTGTHAMRARLVYQEAGIN